MAQTVCVLLDAAAQARLTAIAGDRSRPFKHLQRARIVLLSAERLSVHNNVDPQAWLADVLARIADHPARDLDALLPWNWR